MSSAFAQKILNPKFLKEESERSKFIQVAQDRGWSLPHCSVALAQGNAVFLIGVP